MNVPSFSLVLMRLDVEMKNSPFEYLNMYVIMPFETIQKILSEISEKFSRSGRMSISFFQHMKFVVLIKNK